MANEMKRRYRLFRRNKANYFAFDNHTRNSKSLRTRDRHHAERLLHALNEAESEPLVRRQVGLIYLSAADPEAAKRTWQTVMDTAVEFSPREVQGTMENRHQGQGLQFTSKPPLGGQPK